MRWVAKNERLPVQADADGQGCVLVWHAYFGVHVIGYQQVENNRFYTHWMTPPAAPDGAQDWKDKEMRAFKERNNIE